MKVLEKLLQIKEQKGGGYFVLIDPDKQNISQAVELAIKCEKAGVDALLVGGSLLFVNCLDELINAIKAETSIPVIIFPGGTNQLSKYADAVLFLSLISGRNPDKLIGEQVTAAPVIKSMSLEAISTAYLFIESGNVTTAQFISNTRPIPREKPDIAMAHVLAAEYLGMSLAYLEAGSGAKYSVPDSFIKIIAEYSNIPLIVGGGIRKPEEARQKIEAGASFIVTGNVLEGNHDSGLIKSFAQAVHLKA